MSKIEAEYLGDLCVECKLTRTGDVLRAESRMDDFGKGSTFSPTDLVAAALGSCAMNIMGVFAHKHNIDVTGVKLEINKKYAQNPVRIGQIDVTFHMPAKGYSEKERKGLERSVLSCPVHNSLSEKMEQNFIFIWLDDEKGA